MLFQAGEGRREPKREGDQLSISSERMKQMESVSPAVSEMSGTESRGLFVPNSYLSAVDSDSCSLNLSITDADLHRITTALDHIDIEIKGRVVLEGTVNRIQWTKPTTIGHSARLG